MNWKEEYVDEQIEYLKELIVSGRFNNSCSNNFIDNCDLEDDFSNSEIKDIQKMFELKAREYLSSNYPGEYAIWSDWSVHIATVTLYKHIVLSDSHYTDEYKQIRENRDIIT